MFVPDVLSSRFNVLGAYPRVEQLKHASLRLAPDALDLAGRPSSGLYYKRVTIVIDAPSVIKVTLQIVASLTIVIDDAS